MDLYEAVIKVNLKRFGVAIEELERKTADGYFKNTGAQLSFEPADSGLPGDEHGCNNLLNWSFRKNLVPKPELADKPKSPLAPFTWYDRNWRSH